MATTCLVAGFLAGQAWGQAIAPAGGHVVSGTVAIGTSGTTTTISQSSGKAIIDWTGFSIGQGQTVQFNNGTGATLNRVTGGNLSSIDGLLSATGSVYLINPNGVIIGKTGVVKTGGTFVASTLDINDADFLKGGDLTFDGLSGASVINLGQVGSLGGNVAFMAGTVENEGSVTAANGVVGLLAGHSILMRDQSVDGGNFAVLSGGADTSVTNSGAIKAAAVELRVADGNIYALAGNTDGFINATGVGTVGGKVWLTAGDDGSVTASGRITAVQASGDGGTVETSGGTVDFTGLQVDTTGTTGKTGTWLVDPYDLTIDSAAASTISSNLATTNVTLQTTNTGTSGPGTANSAGTGDITINSAIAWSSANTLTLDAYHGINIDAGITVSGAGGVVLKTNDGGTGGDYSFGLGPTGFAGNLTYTGSGGALTINGSSYALLYSLADLAAITALNRKYALALPADAGGMTYSRSVVPLFSGTFTGLGHTISNLTITSTSNYTGLFGIAGATIRDIGLVGGQVTTVGINTGGTLVGLLSTGLIQSSYATTAASGATDTGGLVGTMAAGIIRSSYAAGTVSGDTDAGGLVGLQNGGTISSSYATGTISGTHFVGGLVGEGAMVSGMPTISASYATGTVSGNDGIGGLAGYYLGIMTMSYATGTVSGVDRIGGLVGELAASAGSGDAIGSISTSYATGATSGTNYVGGLVGYVGPYGAVSSAYATGAVTGTSNVGGLVGTVAGTVGGFVGAVSNTYATGVVQGTTYVGGLAGSVTGTISSSYATGVVSGSNHAGGAIGINRSGTITDVYYDGQTSGMSDTGTGTVETTAQLQSGTLPSGFSSTVWGTAPGLYPYLTAFYGSTPTAVSGYAYSAGSTVAAGAQIGIYSGGSPLGRGTVSTGANGYYYALLPSGTGTASTPVGETLTLSGASTVSGVAYTDTPSAGLNITAGGFTATTTNTTYSGLVRDLNGAFGSSTYASLNSAMNGSPLLITANGGFTFDGSLSRAGTITIEATGGDLDLASGSSIASTASGDAIVLAANGSFINQAGARALSASNGNWLVYSQATGNAAGLPTGDATDGLAGISYYNDAFDFSAATFASTPGSGNRFVHGYAPTLTITPTTTSVIYNGATQTDSYSLTGYVDAADQGADTLSGSVGGLTTSGRNVGVYNLTASGSLVSNENYAIRYGSGALTLTPAALTLAATSDTKTYDATTASTGLVSVFGLKGTDIVSGTSESFTSKNVLGANASTLAVNGGYTVNDGNGGRNYPVAT